jgi:hypothetical protein
VTNKAKVSDVLAKCLLCGAKPAIYGVFVPPGQLRAMAPPGKTRAVWYSLCRRYHRRGGTPNCGLRLIFRDLAELAACN